MMKKITALLASILLFTSTVSYAHNIQLNTDLPNVIVSQKGELIIKNQDISYQPWQASQLKGKVRVLQHIAGRSAVKEKNLPLMEAIKKQKFNSELYQTTNIINSDDAIFGTGAFVVSSVKEAKVQNPYSQVVLDEKGMVKNTWHLKEKESLIIVLDRNGKVKFVQEGKLSSEQIQQIIRLIQSLIKK
ncbi:YtfJ family protein [Avibacterium sp. 21-586]|uniref:YtfJ family protein n=1 Tax=Avibacterium sp. 21-586 TaxID=2911534 RepID=UPI002245C6E2|nr:YtfJ family protein [Avibacterium sp. 21-586]MCW9709304.1 YtfJ family protein [Avibacterium sp. 21-586]